MSGSSINNRVFSPSTIEALSNKKINKNQDENISVKEIKNSITDSKGNIVDSKLKSIGITNQEDIKIIKSEYKNSQSDPNKILFQISNSNNNLIPKNIKPDNNPLIAFQSPSEKLIIENKVKKNFIYEKIKNNPEKIQKFNEGIDKFGRISQLKLQSFLDAVIKIENKDKIKEQNKSLDIFHGKNPEAISILKNEGDEKKLSDDYFKEVKKFKGINNIDISVKKKYDILDLQEYFSTSESPRTSIKLKNNYLNNETKEFENSFRETILNSKNNNLTPSDIIKIALKTTKGDYHKAVSTVHNVFKSITYDLREAQLTKNNIDNFFNSNSKTYLKKLDSKSFKEDLLIVNNLSNLRSDSKNNTDKMGPWYHFFGVQSISSKAGETIGNVAVTAEHLGRYLKIIGAGADSPVDTEKEKLDNLSLDIFIKLKSK